MSAIESSPVIELEDVRAAQRTALQPYIGGQTLAADPNLVLFSREWPSRIAHEPSTRVEYFIACDVKTADGALQRHEASVGQDKFSLRRVSAETGLLWEDATVWSVDFQSS